MFQHCSKTAKQAPPQTDRANVYKEQQAVCPHDEPTRCQAQEMSQFLDPDGITAYEVQPPMNTTGNQHSALSNYLL